MFEAGEYVEVVEDIYKFCPSRRKVELLLESGSVVQVKEKINNERYIVYSAIKDCNLFVMEYEIKKLNKNDVTIVMRSTP
jgi:hypothetical protein